MNHIVHSHRRALPQRIFMTDEKRGAILPAPAQLAPGDAIIVRHYNSSNRFEIIRATARFCRKHHLRLIIADNGKRERFPAWGGCHLPSHRLSGPRQSSRRKACAPHKSSGPKTAAVHNMRELGACNRAHVDACMISPVFATHSHKQAKHLGLHRFARLARLAKCPVYALGGITPSREKSLRQLSNVVGVAGISLFEK